MDEQQESAVAETMDLSDMDIINAKLDTIQAMMIEILEFKTDLEKAMADFQPPNIMKMMSGLLGAGGKSGGFPTLPRPE